MADPVFPQRFGSYVLIEHLARGGMGTVCLAIRGLPGLETVCVIKRLVPEYLDRQSYVSRFFDEANLARRLTQANLVQTFDVGKVGEQLYLAQEHVQGRDVSQLMAACWDVHQPIPVGLAVHIAREVARGLAYAHDFEQLGIIHRDINPPNVRVSFNGEVKLIDFGVAKTAGRSGNTKPHETFGKAFYMSPEQLFNEPVDRRSDIYALGIVFWELLTLRHVGSKKVDGKIAAAAESQAEMVARLSNSSYQPPSTFNSQVPPELDPIVLKCLERNPAKRFQTAGELLEALTPFLPLSGDPQTSLSEFMAGLFDVQAETALLKSLVDAGRPLLSGSAEAVTTAQPAPQRQVTATQPIVRHRKRHVGVYVTAAVTAVVLLLAGREIVKVLRAPTDRPQPQKVPVALETGPRPQPSPPRPAEPAKAAAPEPQVEAPAPPKPVVTAPIEAPAPPKPAVRILKAADLLTQADDAFGDDDLFKALRLSDQALAAGAGAPALVLRGKVQLRLNRARDAARSLHAAAKLRPGDPEIEALLRKADAALAQDRPDKAGDPRP